MKPILKSSSLAVKIAFFTCAASLLWIIIGSGTFFVMEYKQSERQLMDKVMEIGSVYTAGLVQGLWMFDKSTLQSQINALTQLPSISYATIVENDVELLYSGTKPEEPEGVMRFDLIYDDSGIDIELGVLEVVPDMEPVKRNLSSMILQTIIVQAIDALVIGVLIFVLFFYLAGRHIRDIAQQARALSADLLDAPIKLNRRYSISNQQDELGVLETALNDMRGNLINAFNELKDSEERHRVLFETMRQGVVSLDVKGKVIAANPAAKKILGVEENQLFSKSSFTELWGLIYEDGSEVKLNDRPGVIAFRTREPVVEQIFGVYNSTSKTYRWARYDAIPLTREGEKEPYQVNVTIDDITQLKRASESLERYGQIVASTRDLMSFVDDQYVYQAVNEAYLNSYDKKREQIIGFSIPELVGDDVFHAVIKPKFDRALQGEIINFQQWFDYAGTGRRFMNVTYTPFINDKGQRKGVVVSVNDITDYRLAADEVRNLRNYLSNIIDSMPSILIGVDKEGRVTQWNQKAEQETGVSLDEAKGQLFETIFPELSGEREFVQQAIETAQPYSHPGIIRQGGEQKKYEDLTVFPLLADGVEGAVIRIDDVTEQTRLEEMMVQSEKMLSVGGLAAGMAHEINNPLAGVLQTAGVMINRLTAKSTIPANVRAAEKVGTTVEMIDAYMVERNIPRMLDNIIDSSQRMAIIVENMLSFARKSEAAAHSCLIEDLIDKSLDLATTDYNLKKQYDFKITQIVKEYMVEPVRIKCEASKIQQVLLNIFKNGAEAMQEAGVERPTITIRTWYDEAKQMVCMAIKDNGMGMEETTRKRIFEPFYTTKPEGEGTGLGLSVSYFIITENHNGEMSVESTPGQGTEFFISLPVS